jgi:hypothetical protein
MIRLKSFNDKETSAPTFPFLSLDSVESQAEISQAQRG